MRFADHMAIVTGGTAGIGRATCQQLVAEGATVYNLDLQAGEQEGVTHLSCDVRDYGQIQSAVAHVVEKEGRIDLLFANAGIHLFAGIEDTSPEQFENVLSINLKGTFYTLKEVLPHMRAAKKGSVVLMGSDQCWVGKGQSSVYGLTKGAIAQLTKSTAIDYAPHGVRVNCVCPGSVETALIDGAMATFQKLSGKGAAEVEEMFHAFQPIGRMGKPEEIAAVVCFLLAPENSFMTGSIVSSDGGYVAQ